MADLSSHKSNTSFFKYFLLLLCLCVLVVRTTFTESINASEASPWMHLDSDLQSLCLSAVLLVAVVLWFVYTSLSKRFAYRCTGIEIGFRIARTD